MANSSRKRNIVTKVLLDSTTIANGRDFCPIRITFFVCIGMIFYMAHCNFNEGVPTIVGDKVMIVHNYPIKEVFYSICGLITTTGIAIMTKKNDEPSDQPSADDK